MPYYSDQVIEELRSQTDIARVIGRRISLKPQSGRYVGLCPFHNEKTPSFSVSPQMNMFYCFGCHVGGDVFTFLEQYENCSFSEAVRMLADEEKFTLPERESGAPSSRRRNEKKERMMTACRDAAAFYYSVLRSDQGKAGMDYLAGRGLSEETMKRFGLGFAGKDGHALYAFLKEKGYDDALLRDCDLVLFNEKDGARDRFWNRVIFPIMDERNLVVGFGGRVMGDGQPKYLNSKESEMFQKRRIFYGTHLARRSRKTERILCEGYMDVIALHQAGFDQAVATLGTAVTQDHIKTLTRQRVSSVYLAYDSDGAGIKAALRAIPMLREAGIEARVISLSPFKDPDELIKSEGAEAFSKRMAEAENAILFTMSSRASDYQMSDPASRSAFFRNEVRPWMEKMTDPLERDSYEQAVASRFLVDLKTLHSQVTVWITQAQARGESAHTGFSEEAETEAFFEGPNGELPGERIPAGRGSADRRQRLEGPKDTQRLLLSWLATHPEDWKVVSGMLSPDAFEEGVLRRTAEALFVQLEAGEPAPQRILSEATGEDQAEVAHIFSTQMHLDRSQDERRAFWGLVQRVLEAWKTRLSQNGEPADFSKIMSLTKDLQTVRSHLSGGA